MTANGRLYFVLLIFFYLFNEIDSIIAHFEALLMPDKNITNIHVPVVSIFHHLYLRICGLQLG